MREARIHSSSGQTMQQMSSARSHLAFAQEEVGLP